MARFARSTKLPVAAKVAVATLAMIGTLALPMAASAATEQPSVGSVCSAKGGTASDNKLCWTADSAVTLTVLAGGDGAKYSLARNGEKHEIKKDQLGSIKLNPGDTVYMRSAVLTWNTHSLRVVAINQPDASCSAKVDSRRAGTNLKEWRVLASCANLPAGVEARGVLDITAAPDVHTPWFRAVDQSFASEWVSAADAESRMQYRYHD